MRLNLRGLRRELLSIPMSERREPLYRIVIRNEDSPPLEVTGVKARGNVYRAALLGQEGKTYRVCYGSETAKQPRYDTSAVLAAMDREYHPVEVRPGPQAENPEFGREEAGSPLTLRTLFDSPVFLVAVICLTAVVLGWALVRAARRIDRVP